MTRQPQQTRSRKKSEIYKVFECVCVRVCVRVRAHSVCMFVYVCVCVRVSVRVRVCIRVILLLLCSFMSTQQKSDDVKRASSSSGGASDEATAGGAPQYVTMLHNTMGLAPTDVVKLFSKLSIPKFRPRDVALEAAEVGMSVAGTGSYEECVELAKKLAPQGVPVSIVRLSSRAAGGVSNDSARRTPALTPLASAASASELISFLRLLSASTQWSSLLRECVSEGLKVLPAVCTSKLAPASADAKLRQALATLALTGISSLHFLSYNVHVLMCVACVHVRVHVLMCVCTC